MGTRDTRNQTASPTHEPDLQSLYFQDVQTLPLLSDAEVAALARQIRRGESAGKRLRRAGLSSGDVRQWGRQGQQGVVSYERLEDEPPRIVAIANRYAARYGRSHVTLEHAMHPVARKALLLAERVAQGESARQQLIEGNVRLVITVARRYVQRYGPYGLTLLDAMQEGNTGLIRAVDKGFDPDRGTTFSTYAAFWIQGTIAAYLTGEADGVVRIPKQRRARCRKVQQALEKLPPSADLARETGLTEKQVQEALDDLAHLPQWVKSEELLMVVDPKESPEAQLEAQENKTLLEKALHCLTSDELPVVRQHAIDEQLHADIGEVLGSTAGAMRVRYLRARKKLRVLIPLLYVLAEQPHSSRDLHAPPTAMEGYGDLSPYLKAIKAAWLGLQPWPLVQYILWRRCWWHEPWEEIGRQLGMARTRPVQQAYHNAITQLQNAIEQLETALNGGAS